MKSHLLYVWCSTKLKFINEGKKWTWPENQALCMYYKNIAVLVLWHHV